MVFQTSRQKNWLIKSGCIKAFDMLPKVARCGGFGQLKIAVNMSGFAELGYFSEIHNQMKDVTKIGLNIFGSTDKLKLWLNTPNQALGKQIPKELLKDADGKKLVISELIRIGHGVIV